MLSSLYSLSMLLWTKFTNHSIQYLYILKILKNIPSKHRQEYEHTGFLQSSILTEELWKPDLIPGETFTEKKSWHNINRFYFRNCYFELVSVKRSPHLAVKWLRRQCTEPMLFFYLLLFSLSFGLEGLIQMSQV